MFCLHAANYNSRSSCSNSYLVIGRWSDCEELPLSFAGSFDLRQGFKTLDPREKTLNTPIINEDTVRAIMVKDRECKAFTIWHQGFFPKEHMEMMQNGARLKWQAEREDANIWFSIFFENPFVNLVKRLMPIRIVRFCLSI
jgi:hypothetical protein